MNARTTLPNEEQPVEPAAAAKVAAILHPNGADVLDLEKGRTLTTTPRKQRSDAGTKRVKEPEPTGTLSAEQLDTLRNLMQARELAIHLAGEAAQTMNEATERLDAFLESLRGK